MPPKPVGFGASCPSSSAARRGDLMVGEDHYSCLYYAGEYAPTGHLHTIQIQKASIQRDKLVPCPWSSQQACSHSQVLRAGVGRDSPQTAQPIPAHPLMSRSPDHLLIGSPSVTLQTQQPLPQHFQQSTSDYLFMTLQHSFSSNFMAFH